MWLLKFNLHCNKVKYLVASHSTKSQVLQSHLTMATVVLESTYSRTFLSPQEALMDSSGLESYKHLWKKQHNSLIFMMFYGLGIKTAFLRHSLACHKMKFVIFPQISFCSHLIFYATPILLCSSNTKLLVGLLSRTNGIIPPCLGMWYALYLEQQPSSLCSYSFFKFHLKSYLLREVFPDSIIES